MENLTQTELAQRLNRTPRQIRKLHDSGIPRNTDGSYPWPQAHEWWVKFKQEEKERRSGNDGKTTELDRARAAKEWAIAGMRELELKEKLRELVSVDLMEQQVEDCCVAVRSALNNVPGKYAPRIIGIETVGKAQLVLQDVVDEVLAALTDAASQIPDTDGSDTPERPGNVAA